MTDFNKILIKAKELETKMKESQEKIKKIQVEGSQAQIQLKSFWMEKVRCKK